MNKVDKIVKMLLEDDEMNRKISAIRQIISDGFKDYRSAINSIAKLRDLIQDDPTKILIEYILRFQTIWEPLEKSEGHFKALLLGDSNTMIVEQILGGGNISEGEHYTNWVNGNWYEKGKTSPQTVKDISDAISQDKRFQEASFVAIDHFEEGDAGDAESTLATFGDKITPSYVANFIPSEAREYVFYLNTFIDYLKNSVHSDRINIIFEDYLLFFLEKYPFVQGKILYVYNEQSSHDITSFDLTREEEYDGFDDEELDDYRW